jgi:hypothetical protein
VVSRERSCADATDDELIGLLGRWGAQESWTVAVKLGVIRELPRRRALVGAQVRWLPCGLPDAWDEGVGHEVSAELGISLQAADNLIQLVIPGDRTRRAFRPHRTGLAGRGGGLWRTRVLTST